MRPAFNACASAIQESRFGALVASAGNKGCFRKTITGEKGFLPKAAGFENRGEAAERLRPDRLGTVESDLPTAQIKT